MARTIQEIYQGMIASKNQLLPQITNNRPTGVWNRMAYIFAIATNLLEQLFDQYKIELSEIAEQVAYGSKQWLIKSAYEFQFSTTDTQIITWNPSTYKYEYPSIIDSYKIVTQASVQIVTGNQVRVKVAKGVIGQLEKLSNDEYSALVSYFNTICPAGQYIDLVSVDGDIVNMSLDVYFDGQIANTTMQSNVEDAITEYLNGISFGGTIYAASVVDAVQNIQGIINCILINNGGFYASANNNFTFIPWVSAVTLYAGYPSTINLTINLFPQ